VIIEGGLYHVYNRFARGEDVFADPEEVVEFVELLREVKQRDGLTVFAWALLSKNSTWLFGRRQCPFREQCNMYKEHSADGLIAGGDERDLCGRAGTKLV
jgi:hypothetical protein